jgi:predicted ABC-type ATPase
MAEKNTNLMAKPKLLVFAGPNGSGKSTITAGREIAGLYINADEIKKHRNCTDMEAAQEAEKIREQCLKEKRNFTFETVLSTRRNLDLIARAKEAGYLIECIFVLTADPELNVFRVKSRIIGGGHDVPPEKIRSRYIKSLANLKELIAFCDECYVIDNTIEPEIIFSMNTSGSTINNPAASSGVCCSHKVFIFRGLILFNRPKGRGIKPLQYE